MPRGHLFYTNWTKARRAQPCSTHQGVTAVPGRKVDQPREEIRGWFCYLRTGLKTLNTRTRHTDDQGVVYKKSTGNYTVWTKGRSISCTLSSQLNSDNRKGKEKRSQRREDRIPDFVAVGDKVRFTLLGDGSGTIIEVLPRANRLARRGSVPMPSAHAPEQVIASNIDQVVPVFSAARPTPRWNLLDRYLVSAEALNIPALICITKSDLLDEMDDPQNAIEDYLDDYSRIGYRVLLTSAVTGQGMEELKDELRGRVNVLVGKSGVGKSSILNTLQPGLGLRVNEVSRYKDRGKHTTTHLEMFPLEFGGAVIDTPGTREFGLWEVNEADVALFFPEMRPYVGQCRFGMDCSHDEEPGCAIRQAVSEGQISPRRYMSYLKLCKDG
jgi:ribosome biogenesis GTPase / thiamine phosphate phosphatase